MNNNPFTYVSPDTTFTLDLAAAGLGADAFAALRERFESAHREMVALENGAVKNIDEQRQVTHFTDRIAYGGSESFREVEAFFERLRSGAVMGSTGKPIEHVVVNGIGGSALGPQMVQFAMRGPYWNELSREQRRGAARIYFTDNTDPAGVMDILAVVDLEATLVVSISKSGGTRETANNLTAFENAFAAAGVDFAGHAAAITMAGSVLDRRARDGGWLAVWPMAESIGGRTSETAVVGHVPAAAANIDFAALLDGATTMDRWTREAELTRNPAYMLAAAWYLLGGGRGDRNMVIVPYADRLVLLSRYLQQLVMESLGKELDRDGAVVHQGLNVFGNKGGTDAHAFIQQLNDGRDDFFVTFIEILEDAAQLPIDALPMGSYLHNFLHGLCGALSGKGRRVITMTFDRLDAATLGMIIALYERAVAVYAELININAFHQPGVQAYKKVSESLNDLNLALLEFVDGHCGFAGTAAEAAEVAGCADRAGDVAHMLAKMAANPREGAATRVTRAWADGVWRFTVETNRD